MVDEYIRRKAALDVATDWCPDDDGSVGKTGDMREMLDELEAIPAADVRPVVRGKWERMSENDVFGDIHCKCSACGEDWWQGPGWFRRANFCSNCGADMRPEPPEEETCFVSWNKRGGVE